MAKIYLPNKYKKRPKCIEKCSFELINELANYFIEGNPDTINNAFDNIITEIQAINNDLASKIETRTGVVREITIPAGAMTPRTTNGASFSIIETSTNDITYDVLDFDATTSEGACFNLKLPAAWDLGTIKAKFYFEAASGSGTVTWTLKAGSLGDGDTIDTAYGTGQSVTKTITGANQRQISAATAAITIGGTPAIDDDIYFEVSRDVSDTLAVDARLQKIVIQYTESTTEPTAW